MIAKHRYQIIHPDPAPSTFFWSAEIKRSRVTCFSLKVMDAGRPGAIPKEALTVEHLSRTSASYFVLKLNCMNA